MIKCWRLVDVITGIKTAHFAKPVPEEEEHLTEGYFLTHDQLEQLKREAALEAYERLTTEVCAYHLVLPKFPFESIKPLGKIIEALKNTYYEATKKDGEG